MKKINEASNEIIGNTLDNLKQLVIESGKEGENVLLIGPQGVGKELVAELYAAATGNEKVPVNIAGVPSELIESTLFGHIKGAFTGANENKPGIFTKDSEGKYTFFLDEIGDIPNFVQAKLLRFVESGEYFVVGKDRPDKIPKENFRIVAASNKPTCIRDDLKSRFIIYHIPTLPDRKADIRVLIKHFLKKHFLKKQIKNITEETLKGLCCEGLSYKGTGQGGAVLHLWPGNIRELENSLKMAVRLCRFRKGDTLTREDFPTIDWRERTFNVEQISPLTTEWHEVFTPFTKLKPDTSKKRKISGLPEEGEPLPVSSFIKKTSPDISEEELLRDEIGKLRPSLSYIGNHLRDIRRKMPKPDEPINFESTDPNTYKKQWCQYYNDKGVKGAELHRKFPDIPTSTINGWLSKKK